MKTSFATTPSGDAIAVPAFDKAVLSPGAEALDEKTGGAISRAIDASRFKGGVGEHVEIIAPAGIDATRIYVYGVGKRDENTTRTDLALEKAVASVGAVARTSGCKKISIVTDGVSNNPQTTVRAAFGVRLSTYTFDKYRTKLADTKKSSLVEVEIITDDIAGAEAAWASWGAVADGADIARDLVMEAPNVLGPEEYARQVKELSKLGLEIEVLGEAEMTKLGMGALLGVGQGSVQESQLVIMKWNGGNEGDKPLCFVGKGVTFDTGGISLKPGAGMEEMKGDMGGSAAVVGLMAALAGRKAKANVVGIIGLVENMPDGNAQRPGDIVTSMSGQTIEVVNTDAEGRLVLADALWYAQKEFDPQFIINLATLTGAILIALGQDHAGIFSNNDELADRLFAAGKASDETVWRLPLGPEYDRQIDSPVADMKNLGEGRNAGSITAAQFLQRFVNEKPWVHIDIAGVGMNGKSKDPRQPLFGTGFGVRLLDRLVRDYYEG